MATTMSQNDKDKMVRQLVQMLRNDFQLLSTEAKKKHPSVKEATERGGMRLKQLSDQQGFSLKALSSTEDVVRPLLFACESHNTKLIAIALSSLQKLLQYNAIPQSSVGSILATLERLVDNNLEELKVLQTVMILTTSTDTVKGKTLTQVLIICFKLYSARDVNLHNAASVTIRQIVQSLFDRLSQLAEKGGLKSPEPPPPDSSPTVSVDHRQLPVQVRDGYLIFQDLCFLINGDPAAWLPPSLNIELGLGLELLEIVLKGYPAIFAKEKLFSVLLTERVCPLVIKLFSPSSKHRHILSSPSSGSSVLQVDKPTFALHIRLLRILRVLIKEYFIILITQCEIFLSMLVRFLDSDKPLWQRTLAVEVFHLFVNDSFLLKSFCECYDMYQHSTKVFADIMDGIVAFIQSNLHQLMSSVTTPTFGSAPNHLTTSGSGSTLVSQHAHVFQFRSLTVHYDRLSTSASSKPYLLEMLDKSDVPNIPDGYPLVLSMTVLMDAIKSLSLTIHEQSSPPPSAKTFSSSLLGKKSPAEVSETLISSCWSAILAALALLLDTVVDDFTCKKVLESFRIFIELCGTLKLSSPCEAFLTALCKAALPSRYAVNLIKQPRGGVSMGGASNNRSRSVTDPPRPSSRYMSPHPHDTSKGGGAKLNDPSSAKKRISFINEGGSGDNPSSSSNNNSSLNDSSTKCNGRNIECILTLLHLVHQHGDVLDSCWHLILTTLQYITVVLGLSKSKSGFTKPSDSATMLAVVSADKRNEISEIIAKFEDLFSNSRFLSETSLLSLINALCQLSDESLQNKEVSLFPVFCLLDIGLSNMERIEIVWKSITTHLTQLCNCTDTSVRLEAAEALTTLIKTGLTNNTAATEGTNTLQSTLLHPLLSLCTVSYNDVQQKQLDCIEQLLHLNHQMSEQAWIVVLEVISNVAKLPSEPIVRAGFQSLQLIVTDFLPLLAPICLPLCLEVTGQYGLQCQDINISLTSIGQLWNIADYLFQNRDSLQPALNSLKLPTETDTKSSLTSLHSLRTSSLGIFDTIWMLLFQRLSELCVNEQSAIRRSAAQTLFSTLSVHGSLLEDSTWQAVLWQVLFTVLQKVQLAVTSASTSTQTSFSSSIMIHHSRDTEQKQWAETQVLVLTGISRVIQARLASLCNINGFERAWTTLLDTIKDSCCSTSGEVSIAALNSFKMILEIQNSDTFSPPSSLWEKAMTTWQSVGHDMIIQKSPSTQLLTDFLTKDQTQQSIDRFYSSIPNQTFLIGYLEIFPLLVKYLPITVAQLTAAMQIFRNILLMPVSKDVSPFLVPSINDGVMSSVQRLIITCLACVITSDEIFDTGENKSTNQKTSLLNRTEVSNLDKILKLETRSSSLLEEIFKELLIYSSYSWTPVGVQSIIQKSSRVVLINMTPFGLSCLVLSVQLIKSYIKSHDSHVMHSFLTIFLETIRVPFKLRYSFSLSSLRSNPFHSLLAVLDSFFPHLLNNKSTERLWEQLADVFKTFLFAEICDETVLTNEDLKHSEELDIKLINKMSSLLFRSESNEVQVPAVFLSHWTIILNEGSLVSGSNGHEMPFRENFAQTCFEALLQLSFMQGGSSYQTDIDSTSQLALTAILQRSESVLKKYVQEERLSGNCPPSRSAMNEVSLVLKSMTVLIQSLKQKKGSTIVKSSLWPQVCRLYPVLVDCVTCTSSEVRLALKDTLTEFVDIISNNVASDGGTSS